MIGHITYSATSAGVVTIDQNGVATAQAPGSTLITGTIAQTSSNAGYFYTCPPAKIALTVASTGATSANVTLNTPLALTATVTDTNNNVINGLALSYVSTNPGSIAVSATGSVTASYPSNSAITAICQPTTCNPAPINEMGTLGTGVPALSNFVQITSPGKNSNYIWTASPGSPYFVPIDLSTGTIGNEIKLPYSPNSMVLDPTGTTLYFGSYQGTDDLHGEHPIAGCGSAEPARGGAGGFAYQHGRASSTTNCAGSFISTRHRTAAILRLPASRRRRLSPRMATRFTSWATGCSTSTTSSPAGRSRRCLRDQATTGTGICPATNTTSPIPTDPTSYPPNTTANPNNTYNKFCSPDLAITIPDAAAFSFRNDDLSVWALPGDHGDPGDQLSGSNHGCGGL